MTTLLTRTAFHALLSKNPCWLSETASQEFLVSLASTMELVSLFHDLFPEEFRQVQDQPPFPREDQTYSVYEIQFFELVDRHLFPLPLDYWLDGTDDPFGERRLASMIPVEPMGWDVEGDEYEELPLGWQLLLYLMGELDGEFLREHDTCDDEVLFAVPVERRDVSRTLLILRSEAQGGPLASLHLALQMLRHDTDSVYLNVRMEDPYLDFYWTREDVETLHAHFLLAQDIPKQANHFCAWLEEEPRARFALVARLWNTCVRDTPARTSWAYSPQSIPLPEHVRNDANAQ